MLEQVDFPLVEFGWFMLGVMLQKNGSLKIRFTQCKNLNQDLHEEVGSYFILTPGIDRMLIKLIHALCLFLVPWIAKIEQMKCICVDATPLQKIYGCIDAEASKHPVSYFYSIRIDTFHQFSGKYQLFASYISNINYTFFLPRFTSFVQHT